MEHELTPAEAFRLATTRMKRQGAMAAILGCGQSAVSKMLAAGKACPPEKVLDVERATGVSRYDLRPDIYPRESGTPSRAGLDGLEAAR